LQFIFGFYKLPPTLVGELLVNKEQALAELKKTEKSLML